MAKLMLSLSALVCLSLAFVFTFMLFLISIGWFREFLAMMGYFESERQVILSTAEASMKVSAFTCVIFWALLTVLSFLKKGM